MKYVAASDYPEVVADDINVSGNRSGIYEISFKCGTNVPVPDYHWDFSGKTYYNSIDYDVCSYSPNRYVYSLQGVQTGRVHGDLSLMDSYPGSDTKCALFFNGSIVVEIDGFNKSCVSQPSRCSHGFSVSLWMISNTAESGPILMSTGNDPGQGRNTDGFLIRKDNRTLKINMQSCTDGIQVSLKDPLPSGWFHLVTTFHPHNNSDIQVFINGQEMTTEKMMRELSSPTIDAPLLVSGSNGSSGSSAQKEFGLSNVKIFNHKLSLDEVTRLHYADAHPSSLEVLQLQDVSNNPDQIDLQCIVKTCADNPTINWLYYPNITALLTEDLTILYGSTEKRSKCQIVYRLRREYKAGVYVCEPRVGGSYAYKVVKLDSSRDSTLDIKTDTVGSSTLEMATNSAREEITITNSQQIRPSTSSDELLATVTQELLVTDIIYEEDSSREHQAISTSSDAIPFSEENSVGTDKDLIVTRKEHNLENNEEISNFILSIPSASRESVVKELSDFNRVELELLSIEKLQLDSIDYQFEHKLSRKEHTSTEGQERDGGKDKRLIGGIRLPFISSSYRKPAEDVTLAIAYGTPSQDKEYQVNVTSSGEHIQGTLDDGILFIWAFIANKEVSVHTNFSIVKKQVEQKPGEKRHCSFWDEEIRMWSTKGCQTLTNRNSVESGAVTCVCNHTTSFAIILQVVDFQVPYWMKLLSKILGSISICCLLLTMAIFVILHPPKNYRIIVHGNLAASLAGAQLVFMTTSDATQYQSLCQVGAVGSHYLFTAFLTWMLIEGYLLYQKTMRPTRKTPRLQVLVLFGWGIPCIVVASSFALKKEAYGAIYSCWLDSQILQWTFIAQTSLVVLVNSFILIIVMKKFSSLQVNVNKNELEKTKSNTRALCALLPVLGLTWIFGILAIDTSSDISIRRDVFMVLFDVTNCLQGVFILIFHCLRNREILKEIEIRKKTQRNRRSSRSYSSSNQIIRCRTTTGDLLYVPCEQDEKTSENSQEYRHHSGSVTSTGRSVKVNDSLSF
ncbi:uncharacterized protein [Amphiura filiformis]|uniref:uncharacterized protein n=1 Tax=Amphiura filiformis TaxID=82378 RepID=UPI003B2144F7